MNSDTSAVNQFLISSYRVLLHVIILYIIMYDNCRTPCCQVFNGMHAVGRADAPSVNLFTHPDHKTLPLLPPVV